MPGVSLVIICLSACLYLTGARIIQVPDNRQELQDIQALYQEISRDPELLRFVWNMLEQSQQVAEYSGEKRLGVAALSRPEKRAAASGSGRNNWYSPRGTRAGNKMLERGRRDLEEEEFPRNLRTPEEAYNAWVMSNLG